jgi:hypothetical protein
MKRIPVLSAAFVAALTLLLAYGVSAGSGAQNPCPGNYEPYTVVLGEKSTNDADLNGNMLVCRYVGSKADVPLYRDDRLVKS